MARIVGHGHTSVDTGVGGPGQPGNYAAVEVTGTRQTKIGLTYQGVDAAREFGVIESFSYIDEAAGQSDRISINVDNVDNRWANGWMPTAFDKITASIIFTPESGAPRTLQCGGFYADDFTIQGPPKSCRIEAVSKPIKNGFSVTQKSKTWQQVTLSAILTEIAIAAGITLIFDATDTEQIESVEQSKQTDLDFVTKLCDTYGKKVKVYAEKFIVYDISAYEVKKPVAIITPEAVKRWSLSSSVQGTYTGAQISYTPPKTSTPITVTVGEGERILYLNESCTSEGEAQTKARAKVNEENRKMKEITLTLLEPLFITATSTVEIKGFGSGIDGCYFVKKVTHNISSSGYSVSLDAYYIQQQI